MIIEIRLCGNGIPDGQDDFDGDLTTNKAEESRNTNPMDKWDGRGTPTMETRSFYVGQSKIGFGEFITPEGEPQRKFLKQVKTEVATIDFSATHSFKRTTRPGSTRTAVHTQSNSETKNNEKIETTEYVLNTSDDPQSTGSVPTSVYKWTKTTEGQVDEAKDSSYQSSSTFVTPASNVNHSYSKRRVGHYTVDGQLAITTQSEQGQE